MAGYQLPPAALARAAQLIAAAPPLSDGQKRAIQRALGPVVAGLAQEAAKAPQAA